MGTRGVYIVSQVIILAKLYTSQIINITLVRNTICPPFKRRSISVWSDTIIKIWEVLWELQDHSSINTSAFLMVHRDNGSELNFATWFSRLRIFAMPIGLHFFHNHSNQHYTLPRKNRTVVAQNDTVAIASFHTLGHLISRPIIVSVTNDVICMSFRAWAIRFVNYFCFCKFCSHRPVARTTKIFRLAQVQIADSDVDGNLWRQDGMDCIDERIRRLFLTSAANRKTHFDPSFSSFFVIAYQRGRFTNVWAWMIC